MAAVDAAAPPAAPLEARTPAVAQPPQTSLYVGDLQPDVLDEDLYNAFSKFGTVTSVYICRDTYTRNSLGYGYVNFAPQEHENARKAIEELNYQAIKGRPMRIMWVRRDPTLRKTGKGNVFVKNLAEDISVRDLYEVFKDNVGPVMSCRVARDPRTNKSRGYGFVHFENDADVEKALKLSGLELGGNIIEVQQYLRKTERATAETRFTNIYVKSLPASVDTNDKFVELFSQFGAITKSALMFDNETGKSKGFGFINFEKHEDAQRAIDEMHEKEVDGQRIYCARAQQKAERERHLRQQLEERRRQRIKEMEGRNLFVKNLADSVTDDRLREMFSEFGTITSAKVMREGDVSKGFGFVCFANKEDAAKALSKMSQRQVDGKPLYVSLAQRKEDRAKSLNAIRFGMTAMPFPGMMAPYGMMAAPGMPRPGPGMPAMMPGMPPLGYAMPGPRLGPMPGRGMMPGRMGPLPGRGGRGGRGPAPARGPGGPGLAGPVPMRAGGRGGRGGPLVQPGIGAMPMAAPAVAPQASSGAETGSTEILARLSAAPEDQRRNILGEELYPLVQRLQPELAPKITGMFLELDENEVLILISDENALQEKVNEALSVLQDYGMTA